MVDEDGEMVTVAEIGVQQVFHVREGESEDEHNVRSMVEKVPFAIEK